MRKKETNIFYFKLRLFKFLFIFSTKNVYFPYIVFDNNHKTVLLLKKKEIMDLDNVNNSDGGGDESSSGGSNNLQVQKMAFIFNAVESGWSVKKMADKYIFSKKHEGSKEVYLEAYLRQFLERNLDFRRLDFL